MVTTALGLTVPNTSARFTSCHARVHAAQQRICTAAFLRRFIWSYLFALRR